MIGSYSLSGIVGSTKIYSSNQWVDQIWLELIGHEPLSYQFLVTTPSTIPTILYEYQASSHPSCENLMLQSSSSLAFSDHTQNLTVTTVENTTYKVLLEAAFIMGNEDGYFTMDVQLPL
jgi:hypothetical protein